jgi:hypothetical protein
VLEDTQRRCDAASQRLAQYLSHDRPMRIADLLSKLRAIEEKLGGEEKVGEIFDLIQRSPKLRMLCTESARVSKLDPKRPDASLNGLSRSLPWRESLIVRCNSSDTVWKPVVCMHCNHRNVFIAQSLLQ